MPSPKILLVVFFLLERIIRPKNSFLGLKEGLSNLFSEDGVEHVVVSEDNSLAGLGCTKRHLKVTHAYLIESYNRCSVTQSFHAIAVTFVSTQTGVLC